jgi:hypothetical protein
MGCIWKTRARKVEQLPRIRSQRLLQLRWGGVRAHHSDVAENGGHPTGHVSCRDKNGASTCAMPDCATAQRGAFARCCRRSGRIMQPRFGRAYVDPPPQQHSRPHHEIATAHSLRAPSHPRHWSAVCEHDEPLCAASTRAQEALSATCATVSSWCGQGSGGRAPPAPRFHALRQQDACRKINARSHGQGGRGSAEPPQTPRLFFEKCAALNLQL